MELKVVGRLTPELIQKYKHVLGYSPGSYALEILLYCDFSEFEIPTNHVFEHIRFNENSFDCSLLLKRISQEYMLPLEAIPVGWKTVCLFELLTTENSDLFGQLSEITQWSESKIFFVLS